MYPGKSKGKIAGVQGAVFFFCRAGWCDGTNWVLFNGNSKFS